MPLAQLPKIVPSEWLTNLAPADITNGPIPLSDVLRNSLYYPAARFDWDPIENLSSNIPSFVYVDHGEFAEDCKFRKDFEDALTATGFLGYDIVARRPVMEDELVSAGWQPIPAAEIYGDPLRQRDPAADTDNCLWQEDEMDHDPLQFSNWQQQPFFCQWIVWQRKQANLANNGPSRISLLYLRADGVVAFRDLYPANAAVPKAVAIIQPGNNWTDFENPNGIFATSVLANPVGKPEYLLFGGVGHPDSYRHSCWPIYQQRVPIPYRTKGNSIGVWRRVD